MERLQHLLERELPYIDPDFREGTQTLSQSPSH